MKNVNEIPKPDNLQNNKNEAPKETPDIYKKDLPGHEINVEQGEEDEQVKGPQTETPDVYKKPLPGHEIGFKKDDTGDAENEQEHAEFIDLDNDQAIDRDNNDEEDEIESEDAE